MLAAARYWVGVLLLPLLLVLLADHAQAAAHVSRWSGTPPQPAAWVGRDWWQPPSPPARWPPVARSGTVMLARRAGQVETPSLWEQDAVLSPTFTQPRTQLAPLTRAPAYYGVRRGNGALPLVHRVGAVPQHHPYYGSPRIAQWMPPAAAFPGGSVFPGGAGAAPVPLTRAGGIAPAPLLLPAASTAMLQFRRPPPPAPLPQARHASSRRGLEEPTERFSSLPAHFQDMEDATPLMPAVPRPPLTLVPAAGAGQMFEVNTVSQQLSPYGGVVDSYLNAQTPYANPQATYHRLPVAGYFTYNPALPTSGLPTYGHPAFPTSGHQALSSYSHPQLTASGPQAFPAGDATAAAAMTLTAGGQTLHSAGVVSPVQLRRAEPLRAHQFPVQWERTDSTGVAGHGEPAHRATSASEAAFGSATSGASAASPVSAAARPFSVVARRPPSAIKRGDLPHITTGVVMTAAEGLTLPLNAAAAILGRFGSAVAVPFPGMGAAIGKAAGLLGGAADQATKLAPSMAPLLADTLREVWEQAAKAETHAATALGRWEDFNNGVNVFEVTATGDGTHVGNTQHAKNTEQAMHIVHGHTGNTEHAHGQKAEQVRATGHGKTNVQSTTLDTNRRAEEGTATYPSEGVSVATESVRHEPGTHTEPAQGLIEGVADQPTAAASERWHNMDWTQFLLSRRQVQAARGISARHLRLR